MFVETAPTPYDLKWRMFGIPVRVHPFFWLTTALLGLNTLEIGPIYLLIWVVCVFVSVLVHEFGHVLVGRLFGARGQVLLYGLGGLAIGSVALRRRWQRILVYAAGPVADILLFGLIWLAVRPLDPERGSVVLWYTLSFLFWINLFWGALNLLPIWPLDGGQISRDVFDWLLPRNGIRVALIVSIIVAGLLILNALVAISTHHALPGLGWIPYMDELRGPWIVLFFALLAFSSYQALRLEYRRRP